MRKGGTIIPPYNSIPTGGGGGDDEGRYALAVVMLLVMVLVMEVVMVVVVVDVVLVLVETALVMVLMASRRNSVEKGVNHSLAISNLSANLLWREEKNDIRDSRSLCVQVGRVRNGSYTHSPA